MKADPEKRESLQAEAEVDPMDGEQTWPTEAELEEAEGTVFTMSSWAMFTAVCPLTMQMSNIVMWRLSGVGILVSSSLFFMIF